MTDKSSAFTTELLEALRAAIPDGSDVATLARGNSNLVTAIRPDGILIETDRSRGAGTGPQLIPAWMVETAWQHLRHHGTLTNAELLDNQGPGVKRSSAVCAVLARLPGVEVESTRPVTLRLDRS